MYSYDEIFDSLLSCKNVKYMSEFQISFIVRFHYRYTRNENHIVIIYFIHAK